MRPAPQPAPDPHARVCGVCRKTMAEFANLWHCRTGSCDLRGIGVCAECTVMRSAPLRRPVRSDEIQPDWWQSPWVLFMGFALLAFAYLIPGLIFGWMGARNPYVWGCVLLTVLGWEEYVRRFHGNTRWLSAHTAVADDLRTRWSFPRRCCAGCQEELPAGQN